MRAALRDLPIPRRSLRAADVEPMLAEAAERPFSRPGWLFELKVDGFRALAGKQGAGATLVYRSGRDATALYPDLQGALGQVPGEDLLLDGEIAVLGPGGVPSFQRLQKRALLSQPREIERAARELPAVYFSFDLLGFEGRDLRPLPLRERKRLLRLLLPVDGSISVLDPVEADGEALFRRVQAAQLEGMMAKRADSPYVAGRSPDWLKVRIERTEDFAIVGFTPSTPGRPGFGALHLAIPDGKGGLLYAGRVGSGFAEHQLGEIEGRLAPLRRLDPPCTGPAPRSGENLWVEPLLACEVRYREITEEGLLRQPVFLRLRDDKQAAPRTGAAGAARGAEISNPDKLLWPDDGIRKRDLVAYYRAVASTMLPYLRDRALTLTRYPDGIAGKFFFQKNAPPRLPRWVRTARIERGIEAILCDDEATLLYVANLAAIPLHVPADRVSMAGRVDYCVIDLDPKTAPFAHVRTLALAVRELCEAIGLPSFVKTSGQKGLHVLLPLGGACTHEESRTLGELVARSVEVRHHDIASTERMVQARRGRVYLDYLQNGEGKTIVAPYSVRPVSGATVSTPLRWSEVDASLDPRAFTLRSVPERLGKLGEDPLRPVLTLAPDLRAALAKLASLLAR